LAEVLLSSQFIFSRSLVFDKSRVVNGTVARGGAFPPSLPEKLASSAGSPPHLRGTHIAVMYVGFNEPIGLLKFVALKNQLSEMLGKDVDLVMKSALRSKIGERILEEVIYI
jgi:hypothetical protein